MNTRLLKGKMIRVFCFISVFSFLICLSENGYAQTTEKKGVTFSGGIGYYGQKKMNSISPFVNVSLPVKSSLIIVEFSKVSLPQQIDSTDNLKITAVGLAYNYCFEPGRGFMLIGGGLSYNNVNGGSNSDDKNWAPFNDKKCLGYSLNIGLGFYVSQKIGITTEYVAKGIFASSEGEAYGGLRFGVIWSPWKNYH